MSPLSREQIDHYEEHGFVVVPQVLDEAGVERFKRRAREIALGDVPPGAENRLVKDIAYVKGWRDLPEDPEHAIWKIMNPDRFDEVMAESMRIPKVLDAVSSLIGDHLMAFLLMFIYKPPGVESSLHPFHQDAAYFNFGPQERCIGVWIPLDPVSEENGTLTVVPGSHRLDVLGLEFKDDINFGALASQGAEENAEFQRKAVSLTLPPGDCVLFNTKLLHRTGGNRTQGHRRVITLHMADARCQHHGEHFGEFGFTSVRGEVFEDGLQPQKAPSLALNNALVGGTSG